MANLTPEQLRQLQDHYAKGYGYGLFQDGGRVIQSNATQGSGMDNVGATPATEYYSYDPSQTMPGQSYDRYGTDGTAQGQGQFTNDPNELSAWDLAAMIAIGGGAAYGAGMFGGAGAAGAGGASGAGGSAAGLSEAGLAGEGAFGATNAMGGAGAFGPAGSAYYGAGGSGLSEMGLAGQGAFTGTNAAGGAATGSGLGGATMGGAAAGGSGFLSGLGGNLGTLATIGGGLLGAQGNKAENSSTRTMDPRMDGPVFGAGGVVPSSQGLLAEQMDPARQQKWRDMIDKGAGLLGTPQAGNGFAQFAGRKF